MKRKETIHRMMRGFGSTYPMDSEYFINFVE